MLREDRCRGNRRRECSWNFTNVCRVVHVLSFPSFRSNRDSCLVKHLCPYFLAVVPADLYQLLCQANLGFLHPKFIRCLLRGLHYFFGLSKFCLQVRDLLLGRDQLYFGIVELLAFLLSLVLGVLEAGLSAPSLLFLRGQLRGQHLVLLLRCT